MAPPHLPCSHPDVWDMQPGVPSAPGMFRGDCVWEDNWAKGPAVLVVDPDIGPNSITHSSLSLKS